MKNTLISLALLTLLSSKAFGHMVYEAVCDDSAAAASNAPVNSAAKPSIFPHERTGVFGDAGKLVKKETVNCYSDSPDSNALRDQAPNSTETDRTAALNFCRVGGYKNSVACASDILKKNLVDEALACLQSVEENVDEILPYAHSIGGSSSGGGIWHQDYRFSNEDGWHRHDYSDELRDTAGKTYAVTQIELEKKTRALNSVSTTTGTSKETARGVDASAGIKDIVDVAGNRVITDGSNKSSVFESGPLTQSEISTIEKSAYSVGHSDPQIVGLSPNIICWQNDPDCLASSGKKVKNTSYVPENNSNKSSGSNKSPSHDRKSPTPSKESNNSPQPSKSTSSNNVGPSPIKSTDGGHWAGEPTPERPGELWVNVSPDAPVREPMANCLAMSYAKKLGKDRDKNYDQQGDDRRTDAEKKRDAEAGLKKGFCDTKYYGQDYCENWKKKFQLIDNNSGLAEKPLVQPGERPLPPGFLHFDPRDPVTTPAMKGSVGTPQKLPPNIKQ